jgi:hypothetical protein
MLSKSDRRMFAEIERHLQEDPTLRRTFERRPRTFPRGRRAWCAMSGTRRVWWALLVTSLVVWGAMVVLHGPGAALESAAVGAVIGIGLRFTSTRVEHRAASGSMPDGRP